MNKNREQNRDNMPWNLADEKQSRSSVISIIQLWIE